MTENPDPLAQALDRPNTMPALPEPKVKRRRDPLKWARQKNQALILETRGEAEVHDLDAPMVLTKSGAYVPNGRRYLLKESIGPGYVTVFEAGNPEPLGGGTPKGYGAAFLAQVLGGPLTNLALGAWRGPSEGFQVKPWMKIALLVAAGLLLVGIFAWQFTHGKAHA